MINTNKKQFVTVLAIMALAFTPLGAFSADMWAETPDLNDNSELFSKVTESAVYANSRPLVDMWAETPDLNSETENYDFILNDEGRIVSSFNSDMYAETPAIDEIFNNRQLLGAEDTFLAEGR